MARLIPAVERLARARKLIQQAFDLPVPSEMGNRDFSYVANIKDMLRRARDLIKFISMTAGVSQEMKDEVRIVMDEIEAADTELLG